MSHYSPAVAKEIVRLRDVEKLSFAECSRVLTKNGYPIGVVRTKRIYDIAVGGSGLKACPASSVSSAQASLTPATRASLTEEEVSRLAADWGWSVEKTREFVKNQGVVLPKDASYALDRLNALLRSKAVAQGAETPTRVSPMPTVAENAAPKSTTVVSSWSSSVGKPKAAIPLRKAKNPVTEEVVDRSIAFRLADNTYANIGKYFPNGYDRESIRRRRQNRVRELMQDKPVNTSDIFTEGRPVTDADVEALKKHMDVGDGLVAIYQVSKIEPRAVLAILARFGFPAAAIDPKNIVPILVQGVPHQATSGDKVKTGLSYEEASDINKNICEGIRRSGTTIYDAAIGSGLTISAAHRVCKERGINSRGAYHKFKKEKDGKSSKKSGAAENGGSFLGDIEKKLFGTGLPKPVQESLPFRDSGEEGILPPEEDDPLNPNCPSVIQ